MKKKTVLLGATAVMLVAAMSIGGMLAYFTDTDSKENTFTVGNVNIQINEEFEQDSIANPGVKVEKIATIENTGDNAAYVRMKVVFSDAKAWMAGLGAKYQTDPEHEPHIDTVLKGIWHNDQTGQDDDINSTDWGATPIYDKPNCRYGALYDEKADTLTLIYEYHKPHEGYDKWHNGILLPGEETTARFTSVTMPALFDNNDIARFSDDGKPGFTVTVIGEAIQADGFTWRQYAYEALDAQGALPAVPTETVEPTEPVEP